MGREHQHPVDVLGREVGVEPVDLLAGLDEGEHELSRRLPHHGRDAAPHAREERRLEDVGRFRVEVEGGAAAGDGRDGANRDVAPSGR